jgi:hypothetical protein
MLEEIEALEADVQITYQNKMWHIVMMTDHGLEQTLGKKFEDALDALKLRLSKND